jgi:hypothetical protein
MGKVSDNSQSVNDALLHFVILQLQHHGIDHEFAVFFVNLEIGLVIIQSNGDLGET